MLDKTGGNPSLNQTFGKFASFKLKLNWRTEGWPFTSPSSTNGLTKAVQKSELAPVSLILRCSLASLMWLNVDVSTVLAHPFMSLPRCWYRTLTLTGQWVFTHTVLFKSVNSVSPPSEPMCSHSVLEHTERTELVSWSLTLTPYRTICFSHLPPPPHCFAISSYYSGTVASPFPLEGVSEPQLKQDCCCVNAHREEPRRNHLMSLDAIKSFNWDFIAATECQSNYGRKKNARTCIFQSTCSHSDDPHSELGEHWSICVSSAASLTPMFRCFYRGCSIMWWLMSYSEGSACSSATSA